MYVKYWEHLHLRKYFVAKAKRHCAQIQNVRKVLATPAFEKAASRQSEFTSCCSVVQHTAHVLFQNNRKEIMQNWPGRGRIRKKLATSGFVKTVTAAAATPLKIRSCRQPAAAPAGPVIMPLNRLPMCT